MIRCFYTRLWIFLLLGTLAGAVPALAGIHNEGDGVRVEIFLKDHASRISSLYPGQSVIIPEGATSVKVLPTGIMRGDENIQVRIIEKTGEEFVLTKYGAVHILNQTDEDITEEIVLREGRVKNLGNIQVEMEIKRTNGKTYRRLLYLNGDFTIPKDTDSVTALTSHDLRGDEIVKVEVMLPDGSFVTINRLGGIAAMPKETELTY